MSGARDKVPIKMLPRLHRVHWRVKWIPWQEVPKILEIYFPKKLDSNEKISDRGEIRKNLTITWVSSMVRSSRTRNWIIHLLRFEAGDEI